MIKKDITVLIQGPVYPDITNDTIKSVRCFFPEVQIIYSSCTKEHIDTVNGYDQLILVDDPGSFIYPDRPSEKENNINRQIMSTLAGLKACQTKYVIKLRSDFLLTGNTFLDFWDKFQKVDEHYRVFDHKLLACSYFSRNPNSDMPFPFHLSDVAFFGYTKDLINLFDVPLMTKEEAYWNLKDKHQYQYIPEQYLFINCLRKNGFRVDCDYYNDCSLQNIEQTERFFASNFVFLTFEQFNLKPTKKIFNRNLHPMDFQTCYTHIEWEYLYKKYVDQTHEIPQRDQERSQIKKASARYKKVLFLARLCALPFKGKARRKKIRNAILEFFLKK